MLDSAHHDCKSISRQLLVLPSKLLVEMQGKTVELQQLADTLHQLYVSRIDMARGEIGDPEEHGVNGFGNQVQCVASNLLFAIAFRRQLRVGSRMLLRSFRMPSHVMTGPASLWTNVTVSFRNGVSRVRRRLTKVYPVTPEKLRLEQASLKHGISLQTRWWDASTTHAALVMAELQPLLQRSGATAKEASSVQFAMMLAIKVLFRRPTPATVAALEVAQQRLARRCSPSWPRFTVAVRTLSDQCGREARDCGQCVPPPAVRCILKTLDRWRASSATGSCVIITSDSARIGTVIDAQAVNSADSRLAWWSNRSALRVSVVHEAELVEIDARSWHSESESASGRPSQSVLVWLLLASADGGRIYTAGSSFHHTAVLLGGHKSCNVQLDIRCVPEGARRVAQLWRYELRGLPFKAPVDPTLAAGGRGLLMSWQRARAGRSFDVTTQATPGRSWLRSDPGRERAGDLTVLSEVGELARCQRRHPTLQVALAACRRLPHALCEGVTMDRGLPCNVILDQDVEYTYPCQSSALLAGAVFGQPEIIPASRKTRHDPIAVEKKKQPSKGASSLVFKRRSIQSRKCAPLYPRQQGPRKEP